MTFGCTDAAGNPAAATLTVIVRDVTPPVITIVGDNPLFLDPYDIYEEPAVTCIDDVDGAITDVTTVGDIDTTRTVTQTVTFGCSDTANNPAAATLAVIVRDTTPPVIEIIGSNTIRIGLNGTYTQPEVTCIDEHERDPFVLASPNTVSTETTGIQTVTFRCTDRAGNAAETTLTVNVVDMSLLDAVPSSAEIHDQDDFIAAIGDIRMIFTDPLVFEKFHFVDRGRDSSGIAFDNFDGTFHVTTAVIDQRHYALVASWTDDSVQVVDITNPTSPTLITSISDGTTFDMLDGANYITTVVIDGTTYALVTSGIDDGVQIIDPMQNVPDVANHKIMSELR